MNKLFSVCVCLLYSFFLTISSSCAEDMAVELEDLLVTKASPYTFQDTCDRVSVCSLKGGFLVETALSYSTEISNDEQGVPNLSVFLLKKPDLENGLVQNNALSAIFLPFKIIVWQDEKKQTWVSYMASDILDELDLSDQEELLDQINKEIEQLTDDITFVALPAEEIS